MPGLQLLSRAITDTQLYLTRLLARVANTNGEVHLLEDLFVMYDTPENHMPSLSGSGFMQSLESLGSRQSEFAYWN